MPIYPQQSLLLNSSNLNNHKVTASTRSYHHVCSHSRSDGPLSPLLALPPESLANITSFLDPATLITLARTHSVLLGHVNDDNTWHQAFDRQFLAHEPDSNGASDSYQSLLLRRSEDTWKKEFIHRWNLLQRWERSRSSTVAHTPHYSPVASMHLMSERSHGPALLTSSLQYGVVARSLPISGKILKGYINATDHGLGNGNPNAEFSPSVSACAIASGGWSVKVAWGYTNGDVALASANKVMDPGRTSTKLVRCEVNDAHNGRISDVIWVLRDTAFITASVDGTVKIWETKRMRCVWVLNDSDSIVPDPCLKVVANIDKGVVIAAKQSGFTVVWSSITDVVIDRAAGVQPRILQPALRIPPPITILNPELTRNLQRSVKLFLDPEVQDESLRFGLHYEDELQFYRCTVSLQDNQWAREAFGKGLGPLQTLHLYFTDGEGPHPVVLTGDALGSVTFFKWKSEVVADKNYDQIVPPFRRLSAHDDGAITSIACNAFVIVTGSARGTTKVWDTLTLRLLRSFPSPGAKPAVGQEWDGVSGIILERDLLLVSVGSRIMAWKAESIKSHKNMKVKASTKSRANATAKWHKRLEMKQDISESRLAADDEHAFDQRSYGRQRAQLATLDDLGLDEVEAVEYVLMLSRDEEEARIRSANSQEGVFEDDFDDIPRELPSATAANSDTSSFSHRLTAITSPWPSRDMVAVDVRYQFGSPSRLNGWHSTSPSSTKVLVTPPLRPEPTEAGFSTSPLAVDCADTRQTLHISSRSTLSVGGADQFPSICNSSVSSSVSNSRSVSASASPRMSPSTSVSWSSMVKNGASGNGSLMAQRRAMNVGDTSRRVTALTNSNDPARRSPTASWSGSSLLSGHLHAHDRLNSSTTGGDEVLGEEDADLKLAIELSLAEALSAHQI